MATLNSAGGVLRFQDEREANPVNVVKGDTLRITWPDGNVCLIIAGFGSIHEYEEWCKRPMWEMIYDD